MPDCKLCKRFTTIDQETVHQESIVYHNTEIVIFISPQWWPNNPGNVLIIPRQHYSDTYEIPDELIAKIAIIRKKVAIAVRQSYPNCKGISTRQHNEPAGNQSVFHYHEHVTPRYKNDNFYANLQNRVWKWSPEDRQPYTNLLREYF